MKISLVFAYFAFVYATPKCCDLRFVPTVIVEETSLDSITIGWSAPPPGLQDRVHRYKVMATHLNETLGPIYLPRTANSYKFENLSSESSYSIKVAACSQYKAQCGDWSVAGEGRTLSPEEETPVEIWLIIGAIVAVVLLVIIIICICRRRHYTRIGKFVYATNFVDIPLVGQDLERLYADLKTGDPCELLSYDEIWEFPRKELILGETIGCGEFGIVKRAEARFICKSEAVTTVAVKSVVDITKPFQVMILDCEIKILAHLGKHLNVVSLLGACTENISAGAKPLMIMEYCRHGNLRDYLRYHRAYFISQVDNVTGKITAGSSRCTDDAAANSSSVVGMNCGIGSVTEIVRTHSSDATNRSMTLASDQGVSDHQGDNGDENPEPIYTEDLLSWAWQVAHGMKYLGSKGIMHGDLAARNILLTDDKVVKICDFGLAKVLHIDADAEDKKQDFIPLRWSAIESVRDRVLRVRSDIWSYGIVLWEFFSLCKIPYDDKELEILYDELVNGLRLEKPEYATQEIYQMMLHCWASEPCQRPTFNEIAKCIGNLLDDSVKTHYINLSALGVQPYVDALEHWERDFSSMKPPEEKFGDTSVQVDTDASEHDGSGDYLTESQFDEEFSGSNIQVNTDASEQIGPGNYYAITQFKEKFDGIRISDSRLMT